MFQISFRMSNKQQTIHSREQRKVEAKLLYEVEKNAAQRNLLEKQLKVVGFQFFDICLLSRAREFIAAV